MILVVGASGTLGQAITEQLMKQQLPVRALTRTPGKLAHLAAQGAHVVQGELFEVDSLRAALRGVTRVVMAARAFTQAGRACHALEVRGLQRLVDAAEEAGVRHLVYLSALGAAEDSPLDVLRFKATAEAYLRRSRLRWTIVRPAPVMEDWAAWLGQPLIEHRRVLIVGSGDNRVNFVAADDVARGVVHSLEELSGRVVTLPGPENLSLHAFVHAFELELDQTADLWHLSHEEARLAERLAWPLHRPLARRLRLLALIDRADWWITPGGARTWSALPQTSLQAVAHCWCEVRPSSASVPAQVRLPSPPTQA